MPSPFRAKRAVNSIVAAVFLAMTILLIFNLMLFGANLIDATSQQMKLRNQAATEKGLESLIFLGREIIDQTLNVTVFNDGGVSLHIVRLYSTDNSTQPKLHKATNVSYWIDPGATLADIGATAGNFNASHIYLLNLASARGNIFQTVYKPTNTIVATVEGFGWITIDWNFYKYTYWKWPIYGGPLPAWCVTSINGAKYQFNVNAVNHYTKELRLLSWTYLKFASNTGADPKPFFIMDPSSTPWWPWPYNPDPDEPWEFITLPPNPSDPQTGGTPTQLNFYANNPGGTSQGAPTVGDYSILVIFFYQYQDGQTWRTVAQTVPYEASQVTSSTC